MAPSRNDDHSDFTSVWSELDPIASLGDTEAKPFPMDELDPALRDLVQMGLTLTDLGDGFAPMAYSAAICSIGILAAGDLLIETLSPVSVPFSLFGFVSAKSGARKSSILHVYFGGHRKADNAAVDKWTAAMEEYQGAEGEETKPPKPHRFEPKRVWADLTIENFISRAGDGTPYVAIINGEAATFLNNWSGRNMSAWARTQAMLNDAWSTGDTERGRDSADAKSVIVHNAAPTVLLMTQVGNGDNAVLGATAAYGFTARTMLSEVDGAKTHGQGSQDLSANALSRKWEAIILAARERQDAPIITGGRAPRSTVRLTDGAKELAAKYSEYSNSQAEMLGDEAPLCMSRRERGAEYVIRLAAAEVAYQAYMGEGFANITGEGKNANLNGRWSGEGDLWISVDAMNRAIAVGEWFADELERLENRADSDTPSAAAAELQQKIGVIYDDWKSGDREATPYVNREGLLSFSVTASKRARKKWRSKTGYDRLREILESAGAILPVEGKRGRYAVHPDITGGFDYFAENDVSNGDAATG